MFCQLCVSFLKLDWQYMMDDLWQHFFVFIFIFLGGWGNGLCNRKEKLHSKWQSRCCSFITTHIINFTQTHHGTDRMLKYELQLVIVSVNPPLNCLSVSFAFQSHSQSHSPPSSLALLLPHVSHSHLPAISVCSSVCLRLACTRSHKYSASHISRHTHTQPSKSQQHPQLISHPPVRPDIRISNLPLRFISSLCIHPNHRACFLLIVVLTSARHESSEKSSALA